MKKRSSLVPVLGLLVLAAGFAVAGILMLTSGEDAPGPAASAATTDGKASAPATGAPSADGVLRGKRGESTIELHYPTELHAFGDASATLSGRVVAAQDDRFGGGWIAGAYVVPGRRCPKTRTAANEALGDDADELVTGNVFRSGDFRLANYDGFGVREGAATVCLYLDTGDARSEAGPVATAPVTVRPAKGIAETMDDELDFPAGDYVAAGDAVEGGATGARVTMTITHDASDYDDRPAYLARRVKVEGLELTTCRKVLEDTTSAGPTIDLDLSTYERDLRPTFVGQHLTGYYDDDGGRASVVGGFDGRGAFWGTVTFDRSDDRHGQCSGSLAFVARQGG